MLKFLPIILILCYGFAMWFFSAWRTKAELRQNSTPLDHPALKPLLARLGRAMDLPSIRAQVYEIPIVNGLAAPDGRIYITRGFLDRMEAGEVTPEEIASVVAHELGHVAHGHSQRRMIDFAGQNVIRSILLMTLGRFLPFVGPWLVGLLVSALSARLSQKDEFEADRFATALLVKAGIGPEAQLSLFRKLDRMSGGRRAAAPAWLLSHPPTPARIAAIEANRARWQG